MYLSFLETFSVLMSRIVFLVPACMVRPCTNQLGIIRVVWGLQCYSHAPKFLLHIYIYNFIYMEIEPPQKIPGGEPQVLGMFVERQKFNTFSSLLRGWSSRWSPGTWLSHAGWTWRRRFGPSLGSIGSIRSQFDKLPEQARAWKTFRLPWRHLAQLRFWHIASLIWLKARHHCIFA